MLHASWEEYCTRLANTESVGATIKDIAVTEGLESFLTTMAECNAAVYIGRDTRDSSPRLFEHCKTGVEAMGGKVIDIGVVTTPQLHHVVYSANRNEVQFASVPGYFDKIAAAFRTLVAGVPEAKLSARGPLYIDCANGVGALQLKPLQDQLAGLLEIKPFNIGPGTEKLNKDCGAEHLQKKRLPPTEGGPEERVGKRFASFDGDADRVVFYYFQEDGTFSLQDGDKIAALAAGFIAEQMAIAGVSGINLGIVQTAYANGGAHDYVLAQGIACPYAKTGVKYCHHEAEKFDIGVYFEANGHGTAIIKDHVVEQLTELAAEAHKNATEEDKDKRDALDRLLATAQLFNQAVGDSTCDALFVEAVLAIRGWSIDDWGEMYEEKPSRQTKVNVKDRKVVKPIPDETELIRNEAPSSTLQEKIDALSKEVTGGRAFSRPSGTEDVVRVYAEASTQDEADQLAQNVAMAIYEIVEGTDEEPPKLGEWR